MKKTLIILVLTALLLSIFSGCASDTALDPRNPVTLTMWHVYGEQADSPLVDLISEFNATVGKERGIVIAVTNITTTTDIKDHLLEAQSGAPGAPDMPDLFSARPDTVIALGAEHLVDFNRYFSQEDLQDYVPEFLEDGMLDGKLAVFPVSRSTRALFINDSQFSRFSADTGATYGDLETWEGFFRVAEQYHAWSGGRAFCAFDYLIQNVEYDMLASGYEPEYTESGWYDTESGAVRSSWTKFAQPLVQGHIVVSDQYANTQIMTGEVVAGIGSSAAVNYYNNIVTYPDNTSEPMKLTVLPLPKTGTGEQYMPVTGTGFAAWYTTDQKAEAAAVFLAWLTQGQRNLDFVVESGYMPVHISAFEAIDTYDFPSNAHAALFSAIKTMNLEYTPTIRPEFAGYYDRVDLLYAGLKERCPGLWQRSDDGEDPAILAEELWDFFCSLQ